MFHTLIASGVISSAVRMSEDKTEALVGMRSIRSYIDKDGALQQIPTVFYLHIFGKEAEKTASTLVKGTRVVARGTLMADKYGSPILRNDAKRGTWAAYDLRVNSINKMGVLAEGEKQEDILTIILAGNLGKEPEMKYTPTDKTVTSFSLATNSAHKVENETVKETIWWRCSVWGKQAENANTYLHKGSKVLIEGMLNSDTETGGPRLWERQDGTEGCSFELTVFSFKMLDKKGEGPAPEYQGEANKIGDDNIAGSAFNDGDEEIPF